MQYTQEQLKDRYNTLPIDIKKSIDSVEVGALVADIGDRNGLFLDQQVDLMERVTLVMLGIASPSMLSRNLVDELGIDMNTANKISTEINDRVFREIRFSLQKLQERPISTTSTTNTPEQVVTSTRPIPTTPPPAQPPQSQIPKIQFQPLPSIQTPYKNPITTPPQQAQVQAQAQTQTQAQVQSPIKPTFEQAGRFTVDKPPVGMPQYRESDIKKDNVLKGIEDPEISMVDHLLSKPVNTVSGIEVKKPVEKPVVENKPYSSDPYREQI